MSLARLPHRSAAQAMGMQTALVHVAEKLAGEDMETLPTGAGDRQKTKR